MSVKIRLAKAGKKNAPTFKVVVVPTRSKRNGEFLDILGSFNPAVKNGIQIDRDKIAAWSTKGAKLTESVKKLLDNTYNYVKYEPKRATKEEVTQ